MQIETDDYLDQEDAHHLLKKLGVKKSIMWLKLQVMYDQIASHRFWGSRVIHKDEIKKLAEAVKKSSKGNAAAVLVLFSSLREEAPRLLYPLLTRKVSPPQFLKPREGPRPATALKVKRATRSSNVNRSAEIP